MANPNRHNRRVIRAKAAAAGLLCTCTRPEDSWWDEYEQDPTCPYHNKFDAVLEREMDEDLDAEMEHRDYDE